MNWLTTVLLGFLSVILMVSPLAPYFRIDLTNNNIFGISGLLICILFVIIISIDRKCTRLNEMLKFRTDDQNILRKRFEESPKEFPNGWISVLDSADIKPLQVKNARAIGQEFAVFRGQSGKAYVFDPYCPHLGAHIGFGDVVSGENIRCPFHAWEFDNQGTCVSVPGLENTNLPKVGLKVWESMEINDQIFVWYHKEGMPPDWEIPVVPEINNKIFTLAGQFDHTIHCRPYDLLLNVVDQHHFYTIHGPLVSNRFINDLLQKLIKQKFEIVSCGAKTAPNQHIFDFDIKQIVTILGFSFDVTYFQCQCVGPSSIVINCTFKMPIIGHFQQYHVFRTIIEDSFTIDLRYKLYAQRTILSLIIGKLALFFIDDQIIRDVAVWNYKVYPKNPNYTKTEQHFKSFDRWYDQFFKTSIK